MENKIKFKKSKVHGKGVFAITNIKKGNLIEISPAFLVNVKNSKHIDKTEFVNYQYEWNKNYVAFAMGFGNFFNHSYSANCYYILDIKNKTIKYYACKDIKKNEEIFINYNGDPNNESKVWFDLQG